MCSNTGVETRVGALPARAARRDAVGSNGGPARVVDMQLRGLVPARPGWRQQAPAPPAVDGSAGWVLDVGALLAFADGTEYAESVRVLATRAGRTLLVALPALAVAAARRPALGPARLAALLAEPTVVLVDGGVAKGQLFDRLVDRAGGDRLAALVVLLAVGHGWPVLTDRGESLLRLRPDLLVIPS